MNSKLYVHMFKTSLGMFHTAATEKGLALICFGKGSRDEFSSIVAKDYSQCDTIQGGTENKKLEKQIGSYLTGRLKKFSLKLDVNGTAFQKKALAKVAAIPYGKTKTYGEIARSIGRSGAARAVGSANARNRLPIVIPCHRVMAVNGLGGYAGGLTMKKSLLQLEGVNV